MKNNEKKGGDELVVAEATALKKNFKGKGGGRQKPRP